MCTSVKLYTTITGVQGSIILSDTTQTKCLALLLITVFVSYTKGSDYDCVGRDIFDRLVQDAAVTVLLIAIKMSLNTNREAKVY